MANSTEIPNLASELFEMSKSYLDQEALDPLRRTGRYALFSLGGAILYAFGALLLSIAALRYTLDLFPSTPLFRVLAYVTIALVAVGLSALLVWRSSKTESIR
jgi:hypothetical protein